MFSLPFPNCTLTAVLCNIHLEFFHYYDYMYQISDHWHGDCDEWLDSVNGNSTTIKYNQFQDLRLP